jgi:hypothetical protein
MGQHGNLSFARSESRIFGARTLKRMMTKEEKKGRMEEEKGRMRKRE